MHRVVAAVVLVAACADHGDGRQCADGRRAVSVAAGSGRELAEYRDGDGAWERATFTEKGIEVCAKRDYVLQFHCGDDRFRTAVTFQIAATVEDGDIGEQRCGSVAPWDASANLRVIELQSTDDGQAALLNERARERIELHGGTEVSVAVPVDTYDVFASHDAIVSPDEEPVPPPHELFVLRGAYVTVSHPQPLNIDFSQALPMIEGPLAVGGVEPDDVLHIDVAWSLADGTHLSFPGTPVRVAGAPNELMRDGDSQVLHVGVADRDVSEPFTGQEVISLPPHLTGITNLVDGARWSKLPPYTSVAFTRMTSATAVEVTATRAWLDIHAANELSLDRLSPNFLPSWFDAGEQSFTRFFTLHAGDGDRSTIQRFDDSR